MHDEILKTKLQQFINEIDYLKMLKHNDPQVEQWRRGVKSLMQRIGGDKLVKKFNSTIAMPDYSDGTDEYKKENHRKTLDLRSKMLEKVKSNLSKPRSVVRK